MMGWDSGYGSSMMGGGWGVGLFFMFLFGLLILIGFVLLIVWLVRSAGSHQPDGPVASGYVPPPHATGGAAAGSYSGGSYAPGGAYSFRDEATEIARKRLAEGQITPDEYNDIMACLSRQP